MDPVVSAEIIGFIQRGLRSEEHDITTSDTPARPRSTARTIARRGSSGSGPARTDGRTGVSTVGEMLRGITVREALSLPVLDGFEVVAGAAGLDRMIRFVNIMEVPDVLPWTRADELLLTTGYPLRSDPGAMTTLVAALHERGLAAFAVKPGRYLQELPPAMIAEADRLGFPLLLVPDGVGFDVILNQVLSEVLGRQASALSRAAAAHQALLEIVLHGGGLPEVLQALPDQLGDAADGVGVIHVDRSGRVTAAAGAELPPAADVLFDDDAQFRTAGYPHGSHTLTGGVRALVASVVAAEDHGDLIAIRTAGEWDGQDVITLERAATVAALVVARELAVAAVETKYRGDFLRDVLSGRESETAARSGAEGFGWDLTGPLVVVVAGAANEDDQHRRRRAAQLAAAWTSRVRRMDPAAASATFAMEAVAVLHAPDGTVPDVERMAELRTGLAVPGLPFDGVLGVSRVVAGVAGLATAYAQAWEAVRVGRRLAGPGSVARFDDLGLYRLLSLVPDSAELRSFLVDTLGPLAHPEGDVENDELRRTLQVLLDTNLNVAQTARRLHFHYNTLRYRIGKLERLIGPFTDDARLRADLTVALHVWQMRVAHN
ncbi:PucR family transcriptional regulator ligand-binding domain-containing protein [Nakamurella sp. A5-74]|uniref:PucR family transcriptional regulator ligand-binding domain-containing protein n=1 Tax=Nakamurella sp. A5-74 TaxID=3158264 RepID=A0AAU8DQ59_9ACTN